MHRIIGLSFLLVAASCVGDIDDSTNPEEALQISTLDDTTIAGSFTHASSVITFHSETVAPDVAHLTMNVNGAEIEMQLDLVNRTAMMDGYLNALYQEDRDALLALRDEIQARYSEVVQTTLHGKLLAKHADRLAEAPNGYTMDRRVVDLAPVLDASVVDRGHSCNDDGITCLCDGCGLRTGTAYFDPAGGSCRTKSVTYGEDQSWCRGRCGAGCNHWFDDDYTQDCLDHDECVNTYGGSNLSGNSNCGDEFWHADDDYVVTYLSWC